MKQCKQCNKKESTLFPILYYKGKPITDDWNILPLCSKCQDLVENPDTKVKQKKRDWLEYQVIKNMRIEHLFLYPDKNWCDLATYLINQANINNWEV